MKIEEQKILERIKSDDKKAIDQLYKSFRQAFLIYFKRYSLSEEELKDLYQETIVAFYQAVLTGRLDKLSSSLKTYVFGIGKNKAVDLIRKKERQEEIETHLKDLEPGRITLEEIKLTTYQKKLRKSFQQLGESCKNMLTLFYYRGLDIGDIVTMGGYKDANTVKSHKSRCLKQLRTLANK